MAAAGREERHRQTLQIPFAVSWSCSLAQSPRQLLHLSNARCRLTLTIPAVTASAVAVMLLQTGRSASCCLLSKVSSPGVEMSAAAWLYMCARSQQCHNRSERPTL